VQGLQWNCPCPRGKTWSESNKFFYMFEESPLSDIRKFLVFGSWSHYTADPPWKLNTHVDWCCFYYSVRNSLVALLEALCARVLFFRFVNIGFSWHFFFLFLFLPCCMCKRPLIMRACLCVCLRMCMWRCAGKVINILHIQAQTWRHHVQYWHRKQKSMFIVSWNNSKVASF